MDFASLALLFAAAVTIHNLEEAIWLPGWSKDAGHYHVPVLARQFRFAVLALTVAAWALVGWSALGSSFADYLVSGYALAMLVNVVFPHLAATFAMRRYAPGTATAVLFGGSMLALLALAGLSMTVWIVYTIWVGVLSGEPAANRYGPPPDVPAPVPAAAPPAA